MRATDELCNSPGLDKRGYFTYAQDAQKSFQGRGANMNDRAIAGAFVTETFDYDGGRQVTVYVPPDPPEAVVFAGDGQRISQWGRSGEKSSR
jgi:hypothetical protein